MLHDEDLAAAILDRILEPGRLLQLDGPSGWTRHLQLEKALPGGTESARTSGTHTSPVPRFVPQSPNVDAVRVCGLTAADDVSSETCRQRVRPDARLFPLSPKIGVRTPSGSRGAGLLERRSRVGYRFSIAALDVGETFEVADGQ